MKTLCEDQRQFHQTLGKILITEHERKNVHRGVKKLKRVTPKSESQEMIF